MSARRAGTWRAGQPIDDAATQRVAAALRRLDLSSPDWTGSDAAAWVWRWNRILTRAFFHRDFPLPEFEVGRLRKKRYTRYSGPRDRVPVYWPITVNATHVAGPAPEYLRVGSLLHDLIHIEAEWGGHGGSKDYHAAWFVERSRDLGIPCPRGRRCCVTTYGGRFAALLKKHGVFTLEGTGEADAAPPRRRNRRWWCLCGGISADHALAHVCLQCGHLLCSGPRRPDDAEIIRRTEAGLGPQRGGRDRTAARPAPDRRAPSATGGERRCATVGGPDGPSVAMSLRIAGGRIVAADYDCQSPPDLAAAAGAVVDLITGRAVEEALGMTHAHVLAALGGLPRDRERLAGMALAAALRALREGSGDA